jgi:hypothetical protein
MKKKKKKKKKRKKNEDEEEMWSCSKLNSVHRTTLIKTNRIRSEIKYTYGQTFAA